MRLLKSSEQQKTDEIFSFDTKKKPKEKEFGWNKIKKKIKWNFSLMHLFSKGVKPMDYS